jgi:LacI family transcriptional regulator
MLDIAEKAGVSRTTVSFVLNGQAVDNRIPEDTRKRILEIASDLGYRRNELARATKMGQSRVLCFLAEAPHLDADFKTRVLAGVLEEASNSGYAVKVQYLPAGGHKVYRETIERCIGWRLAGIIAVNLDNEEVIGELYQEMAHYRIAVAVVKDVPPVT